MEIGRWDFVAYKIGGKIAVGAVLQCLDRGAVRVDTDGVIDKKCIVAVEHGKGKDVIYRSKAYTENESYRVWLRDNYGLPIKEV